MKRRRDHLRLVILHRCHLDSVRRMREDWRTGVSLEPGQPPWATGAGKALSWDHLADGDQSLPVVPKP